MEAEKRYVTIYGKKYSTSEILLRGLQVLTEMEFSKKKYMATKPHKTLITQ